MGNACRGHALPPSFCSATAAINSSLERLVEIAEAERLTASEETNAAYTLTGLPFSGTTTAVACPFISATNLSAFGSMIGTEP